MENKIKKEELYIKYNIKDFIEDFDQLEEKWQEEIIDKDIYDFYSQKWSSIKSIEDIKFEFNKRLGAVYQEKDEVEKQYNEKIQQLQKELEKTKTQLIELKGGSRFYRWMKFFKNND